MGNTVLTNELSVDFRVLRKYSIKFMHLRGQRHRLAREEIHKISNKLVAYIRPYLADSEVSPILVSIFHIDRMKLLTSFRTSEVFVSSFQYNLFNKTVIACTPAQTLDAYSLKGKGAVLMSIPLPHQAFLTTPKIACINKFYASVLFPLQRASVAPCFYMISMKEKTFEQILYPSKLKCLISIEATYNSTIIVQGMKKGGNGVISIYSFARKSWLKELQCSSWTTIKRVFPSTASNQIFMLKETLFRSFLLGYRIYENGTSIKLFEIEVNNFSSIDTVQQVTENLLIASCSTDDVGSGYSQKVVLINPKLEKYYMTNFQGGVSCNINKKILCNFENSKLKVTKIPLGLYILDKILEHQNSSSKNYKTSDEVANSLFCSLIEF